MALQYAKLEVPLGLGIQTDVDPKLLPVGKVVVLENGVWERGGEILKRFGSILLGAQYASPTPGNMPSAWQLGTHKGALVTLSKAGLRNAGVYSPGLNKFAASAGTNIEAGITGVASKLRGQVLPRRGTVFRSNAAGSSARVTAVDFATDGTYMLICWLQSNDVALTAAVKAQIMEVSTGKTLYTFSDAVTYGTAYCRAVLVNSQLQLVIIDGANVEMSAWTIANIAAGNGNFSGPFTLATDATGGADVIASGTDLLVIYTSTTTVKIIRRTAAAVITVSVLVPQGGGTVSNGSVAWMTDLHGVGRVAAIVASGAQNVRVHWDINTATGATALTYLIDGTLGASITQLAGQTITNLATGEFVILYYHDAGAGTRRLQWGRRFGGANSNATWIWSASLASKPFLHGTDFYVQLAYESDEQGTAFTVRVPSTGGPTDLTDGNRTPSAKAFAGSIGTRDAGPPPTLTQLSTHVYMTACKINVRLVEIATAPTSFDTGVDTLRLTFDPANVNSPRQFADSMYVCGGVLGAFDGMTFAEEGFHLFPEAPTLTQIAGGSLAALGNYSVGAVYRWTDDNGRVRRSVPSEFPNIALTGANQTIRAVIKTLKFHGRPGKVVIEVYSTTNNAPEDHRLVAVVANTETTDTVTVDISSSDTTIGLGEQLYTDGGALENEGPPPALSVASYKDRLAVIAADDPTLVMVSLPLSETEGPRFNSVSAFRVDDGRGDLTVHAAIDDRLVLFKDDAIYAIQGDGPDAAGNGTFGLAQIVASGIGCSEPRSVVQVPDGIMFKSSATSEGIFLVNRGLAVEYVGAPVQKFLIGGATIVDAVHIPEQMRTEFFTNFGTTLVYDHTLKLWSTFTNQTAIAATVWNGGYVYQGSSSNLFLIADDQNGGRFDDSSSPVEEYIETPWISAAQLKGYLRFKRIQLVGETRTLDGSGYKLTITLFFNFNPSVALTVVREMLEADDINAVEVRYSTKVSSLKIGVRLSLGNGGSANFPGPKLSAVTLVYAVKEGLRKIASGNRLT